MNFLTSCINLFYPNRCLHCFAKIEKKYFCEKCISFFSYLYPKKDLTYFAVFEKKGPIITLLKEIKKKQLYGLIKLAASFIVIQHSKLNWQEPDVIVPSSKNIIFKDHIYYLSKEVAKLFDKPISNKSNFNQTALFIDDVLNKKNIEKLENEHKFKKTYYISLCFDIFFDDFNLSE
jgi:predicted amidophosphoribosyltransferase